MKLRNLWSLKKYGLTLQNKEKLESGLSRMHCVTLTCTDLTDAILKENSHVFWVIKLLV